MPKLPRRSGSGGRAGRGKEADVPLDAGDDALADQTANDQPAADQPGADQPGAGDAAEPVRRRPLDVSEAVESSGGSGEAPEEAALPRLDLGSIRVPILPQTEVRIELNDERQPVAATILHGGSTVQILAFAAPRGEGIWDDVRAEIADSVRTAGGEATEVDGLLGLELRARVRSQSPTGQTVDQHLRFVGFDGPRWFLRGLLSGPAATDPKKASVLESVLTSVVVVRGNEPMAPRDPLPLRLPQEVIEAQAAPGSASPGIEMPERGPEITETR